MPFFSKGWCKLSFKILFVTFESNFFIGFLLIWFVKYSNFALIWYFLFLFYYLLFLLAFAVLHCFNYMVLKILFVFIPIIYYIFAILILTRNKVLSFHNRVCIHLFSSRKSLLSSLIWNWYPDSISFVTFTFLVVKG